MKIIKCRIGNTLFGLNLENIEEIVQTVKFYEFPGQTKYCIGFINYRGTEIQLLDTSKVLKLKFQKEYYDQIIIVVKNRQIAFLFDEINDIIEVNDEDKEPLNDDIPNIDLTDFIFIKENYPVYNIEKMAQKAGMKKWIKKR